MNTHQRYLIEEFAEEYLDHRLARRDLLRRVLLITGSVATTASVLTALGCSSSSSKTLTASPTFGSAGTKTPTAGTTGPVTLATVAADDLAVDASDVRFKGPASDILGYLAKPKTGPAPAVLIIHENQGLLDHFRDVARRYAKLGFVGFAIDLLSRFGGTGPDNNTNIGALGRANPDDLVADLIAAVGYFKGQSFVRGGSLGVTGFCFGGNYAWETAIASPDVRAAVPYYGMVRLLDQLPNTRAAVLAIYGGNDTRVTSQSTDVQQRLKAAGKTIEVLIEPGAGHAFFNDQKPSYNADAAQDAWQHTIAWFRQYL